MTSIRGVVSLLLLVVLISFGISPTATANDGDIWTSRISASDNDWNSVTYGNGLFVAVSASGSGNRVMTSPDGITWTSRTSAADNNWRSVTYGNGLFVAVSYEGTGNRVMTSPDGITWTSRSAAADNAWLGVTYGNGLFVAVSYTGTGNRVMTSPDGITWTSRNSAVNNNWISVTYGNGLFVAVSYTGTGNRVMTSPSTIVPDVLAGLAPTFSVVSTFDSRFTVQITNFDPEFTYTVSSTGGSASINATGLVTVTNLGFDQSATLTVTTTRTGYASESASISGRTQVAPMLPSNKPIVTISDTAITCTIGSYSATPTSSAFSLFVDGKHISTNFSALGDYLPDWIIPWATSSTITRTATLTSATWSMNDAYKGKAITCSTLAYSKNAIGFTTSQVMVAK
jgi:hypothetical protein